MWVRRWNDVLFKILGQCNFADENENIYISNSEWEYSRKTKGQRKEKNYDVIVPQQQEQRKFEKNLYQRTKRRKEKYEMINATVYELNDLTS